MSSVRDTRKEAEPTASECLPTPETPRILAQFRSGFSAPELRFAVVQAPGSSVRTSTVAYTEEAYAHVPSEIWALGKAGTCLYARAALTEVVVSAESNGKKTTPGVQEVEPRAIGQLETVERTVGVEHAQLGNGELLFLVHYFSRREWDLDEQSALPVVWEHGRLSVGEAVQVKRDSASLPRFVGSFRLNVADASRPTLELQRSGVGAFPTSIKLRAKIPGHFVVVERSGQNQTESKRSRQHVGSLAGTSAEHAIAVCDEDGERYELSQLQCPDGTKPGVVFLRDLQRKGFEPIHVYQVACGSDSRELYLDLGFCARRRRR